MVSTWRATQKASRRENLLRCAAALFAERGFAAVSTADLGNAVGISGPALYKHFPSKEAILTHLLIDTSERLLADGRAIIAEGGDAPDLLRRLIIFHVDFATAEPDIIRIQDRELAQLPGDINYRVRRLQRAYVAEWDRLLSAARPEFSTQYRQTRLLATFGLLNSTPYSAQGPEAPDILIQMAIRALLGDDLA